MSSSGGDLPIRRRPDGLTAASRREGLPVILWPSGSVYPLAVIFRMRPFAVHGEGLKMQARRERLPDRRRFPSSMRPVSSSEGLKMQARREGLPDRRRFRHRMRPLSSMAKA